MMSDVALDLNLYNILSLCALESHGQVVLNLRVSTAGQRLHEMLRVVHT